MKKLFRSNYDIDGNEISRVTRMSAFAKIIPVGNLQRGPGLRCLMVLTVLHYMGRPVFYYFMRHEGKVHRLYQILSKLRGGQ